jgi:hypothetical protein
MNKHIYYPLLAFVVVFLLHIGYSMWQAARLAGQWAQVEGGSSLFLYFGQQNYLLGFSYALAGAFTVYAINKFFDSRESGLMGAAGGLTLSGIIWAGACFLLGCCGSPMLPVYLGLFGPSFLGLTKILLPIVTTASVAAGYVWLDKSTQAGQCNCAKGGKCDDAGGTII